MLIRKVGEDEDANAEEESKGQVLNHTLDLTFEQFENNGSNFDDLDKLIDAECDLDDSDDVDKITEELGIVI